MQVVVMRIATSLPKNSQILIKRGRVVQALYQGGRGGCKFYFCKQNGCGFDMLWHDQCCGIEIVTEWVMNEQ
jgi:hypothetical protein